jgi:DNA-binding NarL/FixJ family response regulator
MLAERFGLEHTTLQVEHVGTASGLEIRRSRVEPGARLIADDDPLFLDALEAILGIESQIEIAGRAHDGRRRPASPASSARRRPDGLSMPVIDGFEASRRIRPRLLRHAVIVLTGSSYAEDVEKAYDVGCAGYVTKDRIAQDLVRTVLAAVA